MKKIIIPLTTVIILFATIIFTVYSFAPKDHQVKELKQEIKTLEKEVDELKALNKKLTEYPVVSSEDKTKVYVNEDVQEEGGMPVIAKVMIILFAILILSLFLALI